MSTDNQADSYSNPTRDMSPMYRYIYIVKSQHRQQRSTVDRGTQTDTDPRLMTKMRKALDRYEELERQFNTLKHTMTVLNDMWDQGTGDEGILRSIQINNYQPITEVDIDGNINVILGKNHTTIPLSMYNKINWKNYSSATRKLLSIVFTPEILATHSLSGKPSPAYLKSSKPEKPQLNPQIVSDIVEAVTGRCRISQSIIRSIITTKCADESKMYRRQNNKENFPESAKRRF